MIVESRKEIAKHTDRLRRKVVAMARRYAVERSNLSIKISDTRSKSGIADNLVCKTDDIARTILALDEWKRLHQLDDVD